MHQHRVIALCCVLTVALASCDDDAPADATAPTAATTAGAIAPDRTATSSATAAPTPFVPSPGARTISGLFDEPRPAPADRQLALPTPPPSPYPAQSEFELVLYDTQTGDRNALGPGSLPDFSPDGRHLAWTAPAPEGQDLWVLELETMRQQSLGPARLARWIDARTLIAYLPGGNELERVAADTGARSFHDGANFNPVERPVEAGEFRLERLGQQDYRRQEDYPFWRSAFRVTDLTGHLAPLEFEAFRAVLADDGTLALAAVPATTTKPPAQGPHVESGDSNVFLVDPATGVASFVATSRAVAPNWPFAATTRYVAWSDGYCNVDEPAKARTRVYDREAHSLTEFDRGVWLTLTPRGELGIGEFGPHSLFDLASSRYTFVLPPGRADVAWSPDYRYAARGYVGGHGGLCG